MMLSTSAAKWTKTSISFHWPKVMHGLRHPDGPDNGDLPNLYVAGDGTARADFYTTCVAVQDGEPALLDADGSAVIIHENPDDHMTPPVGGAGGRIACGIIERVPPVKAFELRRHACSGMDTWSEP